MLERGKNVRERTQDTFGFWRKRQLNPESNVQFGEGGAGTFSDGKLHTQIRDPKHYGRKVLAEFVKAGAPEEILYIGKPHIGTFKLVRIIEQIRGEIISLGGEFRFQTRVDDLLIENGQIRGVILENGETIHADHVVLALGHSARDTFEMLYKRGVHIEAKPFSIGFRIEHPQSLIDAWRARSLRRQSASGSSGLQARTPLQEWTFRLQLLYVSRWHGRCGGFRTGKAGHQWNEPVLQKRKECQCSHCRGYHTGRLSGFPFGRNRSPAPARTKAFEMGGSNYNAPCQLVGDFLKGKPSTRLGTVEPSYKPGVTPCDLGEALPGYAIDALREAIPAFERTIPGFALYDAVLTGTETRTSSPIRIVRNRESLQSVNIRGLYPAGEGAGYAGGILSSAVDGIQVAEAIAKAIHR